MINSKGNSDLTLTTMTPIHHLNLTDTEYAALAAQGYNPQDCSRDEAISTAKAYIDQSIGSPYP